MAFNRDRFRSTEFKPRQKSIPVPQLREFFGNKAKPRWIIRSMTGEEFYGVKVAAKKSRDIKTVIESLFSSNPKVKIDAALEAIGITDELPEDYIQRLEMLVIGTVDPEIEKEDAVRLAKRFPILFDQITGEIMMLTGAGQELGESSASGTTRKSKTA
jgi:hypothetical protein